MTSESLTAIIVAVLGALGLIIPAGIELFAKLREIERNTSDVRAEVKNSHSINLRDDLDAFRDEMRASLAVLRDDAQLEHAELWEAITGSTGLPDHTKQTHNRKQVSRHGQTRIKRDPKPRDH